MAFYLTLQ